MSTAPNKASMCISLSKDYVMSGVNSNDFLFYVGNSNQNIIYGISNANQLLTIKGSGKVGVNTSNPAYTLDVRGVANISSNLQTPFLQMSNALIFSSNSNIGFGGQSNPAFTLDVLGDFNFSGKINKGGVPYVGSQFSNNGLGIYLLGSNVGIGTINPQAPLHVASNMRVDHYIRMSNALIYSSNSNIGFGGQSNPNFTVDILGNLNFSGSLNQGGTPYIGSQFSNVGKIVYITNSNLGIGTMNPLAPLHIASNIQVDHYIRMSNALIYSSNSNIGFGGQSNPSFTVDILGNLNISGSLNQGGSAYIGSQFTNVGKSIYVVNSNLGIGTTLPQAPLHVASNMRVDGAIQMNGALQMTGFELIPGAILNNSTQLILATSNIQGYSNVANSTLFSIPGNTVSDTFKFVTGSTSNEVVRITGTGLLGVGTSTPAFTLDVNGPTNISSNLTLPNSACAISNAGSLQVGGPLKAVDISGNSLTLNVPNGIPIITLKTSNLISEIANVYASGQYTSDANYGDLVFRNTSACNIMFGIGVNNSRLCISKNSNIGIWTSTPAYTLDVNGTANISSNLSVLGNVTLNSNLTIIGKLTACNVQYVTSNITIFSSEVINSNLNVYQLTTMCNVNVLSNMSLSTVGCAFSNAGNLQVGGNVSIAGGLNIASSTLVTNLNAQYLNGNNSSYYTNLGNMSTGTLSTACVIPASCISGNVTNAIYATYLGGNAASYYTNLGNMNTGTLSTACVVPAACVSGTVANASYAASAGSVSGSVAYATNAGYASSAGTAGGFNTPQVYIGGTSTNVWANLRIQSYGYSQGSISIDGYNSFVFVNGASSSVGVSLGVNNNYWSAWSDERIKDVIAPIDNGLSYISKMNPVSFKFKKINTNKIHYGLLAQEMQEILPDIISENESRDPDVPSPLLAIQYEAIIPFLISAIKQQQQQIDNLCQNIDNLKALINVTQN